MIRAAGGASPPPEGLLTPAQAAEMVETYYSVLDTGLATGEWDRTKARLETLGQEALARMTNRNQGRP